MNDDTVQKTVGLATPIQRLAGNLLDTLLLAIVAVLLLVAFVGDAMESVLVLVVGVAVALGYAAWVLYSLLTRSQTPGKRIVGIKVIRADGTDAPAIIMLIRETVGKMISGMFLGSGVIWILFDRNRQDWHDKLMNTLVVKSR